MWNLKLSRHNMQKVPSLDIKTKTKYTLSVYFEKYFKVILHTTPIWNLTDKLKSVSRPYETKKSAPSLHGMQSSVYGIFNNFWPAVLWVDIYSVQPKIMNVRKDFSICRRCTYNEKYVLRLKMKYCRKKVPVRKGDWSFHHELKHGLELAFHFQARAKWEAYIYV